MMHLRVCFTQNGAGRKSLLRTKEPVTLASLGRD